MEDPTFLHQWHLSSIDDPSLLPTAATLGETLQPHSFSYPNFKPKTSMETALTDIETPRKHHKSNSWSPNKIDQTSEAQFVSYRNLPSFVDSNYINQLGLVKATDEIVCHITNDTNPPHMIYQGILELGNEHYVFKASQDAKKVGARHKLSKPQDHILAERKRREKLSQRFIALSALIPALENVSKFLLMCFLEIYQSEFIASVFHNFIVG